MSEKEDVPLNKVEQEKTDPDSYKSSTDPKHIAMLKNLDPMQHDCRTPTVNIHQIEKTDLKTVMHYQYREWPKLIVGLTAMFVSQTAAFVVPWLLGRVIDAITLKNMDGEGGIVESCLYMVYVIVFSGLAAWVRGYSFNSMGEYIASNIRYDLFYSIINKDIGFFDENKTG